MPSTRFRTCAQPAAESKSHPAGLTLERGVDGRLRTHIDGHTTIVHVQRCFPWSAPERFISLRDADGEELALVPDPAELTGHGRAVLEGALAEASFVFDVDAVLEIEEEVELRSWQVHTHQGTRRFQTRLDDWPHKLPDGGLLIRDVTGDFYRVGDVAALDRGSIAALGVRGLTIIDDAGSLTLAAKRPGLPACSQSGAASDSSPRPSAGSQAGWPPLTVTST